MACEETLGSGSKPVELAGSAGAVDALNLLHLPQTTIPRHPALRKFTDYKFNPVISVFRKIFEAPYVTKVGSDAIVSQPSS